MKRSPMNNAAHGSRSNNTRYMYNWKSHENASSRGYHFVEGNSSQHFFVSDAQPQTFNDNFIPLNVSTPMTQHGKHNVTNQYSFTGGRGGSPGSGWCNNYRNNYHTTPRSNYSNRYSTYKHSPKQFHGQKRKSFKKTHRQVISAYVDVNSFLEDPWEELVKKLNNSKDTNKSEESESELLSNSKLVDKNLIESSESKLLKDTDNLDDLQCSQENKNDYSIDTSFEMQNTDHGQISKIKSLIKSKISDVCSNQDLLNKSMCNVNDKVCGATQEKDIHLNAFLIDADQNDI